MTRPRPEVSTKEIGDHAEALVETYLRTLGVTIIGRNVRLGRLEIDIVAREGRVILVVEVRSRGAGALTSGFSSMDRRKRERIRCAGERLWNRRFKSDSTVDRMRFDAASVDLSGPTPRIEYGRSAF